MNKKILVLFLFPLILLSGCRGYRSEKPPIHPNPNLDWQAKIKAQTNPLLPPENTVPYLSEEELTVTIDQDFIKRGQERYNIYCSPCHDQLGSGQGMVVKRGYIQPPDLSEKRIVLQTDTQLVNIISNGIRNMPGYHKQIPIQDRWAIVAYIRELQKMKRINNEN